MSMTSHAQSKRQPTTVPLQTRAVRFAAGPLCDGEWVAQFIEGAAEAGFNAAVFDAYACGVPAFPSRTATHYGMRASRVFSRRADLLDHACRAAREHEVCLYAGFDLLRAGIRGQQPCSPIVARHRDWLARGADGAREAATGADGASFICPRNRNARDYLSALAAEIGAAYPVTGIFFDLAWLPDGLCSCPACADAPGQGGGAGTAPADADEHAVGRADAVGELVCRVHAALRTARRGVLTAGRLSPDHLRGAAREIASEWISDAIFDVPVLPAESGREMVADLVGRHYLAMLSAEDSAMVPPAAGGWLLELGESPELELLHRTHPKMTTAATAWEADPLGIALSQLDRLIDESATDPLVHTLSVQAAQLLRSPEKLCAAAVLDMTDVMEGMRRIGGDLPQALGEARRAMLLLECTLA
jgi:hypothetical protein